MSDIPQARSHLLALKDDMINRGFTEYAEHLDFVLSLMVRRKRKPRAARQSATMTDDLKQEIYDFAMKNPYMSSQAIGNHFNVNSGRVSEALIGLHELEVD